MLYFSTTKSGHKILKTISNILDLGKYLKTTRRRSRQHPHSLRSGGASSGANNHISDRLISKEGYWSSEKARNGYVSQKIDCFKYIWIDKTGV